MSQITYEPAPKTIQDLINLYEDDQLNLEPGFQRASVWQLADRKKLIDSILRNYPLPSIFLYKREQDGEYIYDVIDGKQRIESLFMFMGLIRGQRFSINTQLSEDGSIDHLDWRVLGKQKQKHRITGYKIQSIEVAGDLSDIIDLFVRINSTGKALTSAEKRHAKYYNSKFLRIAGSLAERYRDYFTKNKILSKSQLSRMKHVELICELMISIHAEDVINKKAALDKVMKTGSITEKQALAVKGQCIRTLNSVTRMFPIIKTTRFRQISDFYSLAVLIWKFDNDGLILTNKRKNKLASDLLRNLSSGVDTVRELQKSARGAQSGQELYREYLVTVLRGTDEITQRRKREELLRGILESLFEQKDCERGFSREQRRIIWNSEREPKCSICGKAVTWEDFTADHIKPFSKGGKTALRNAAIAHRSCNSKKSNK